MSSLHVTDPAPASTTTTALLDAAEAAFARDGVEHASLRAIMRAADANPAAVHYHFGSRESLAGEVLDRVLQPLQARRLELLDQLVVAGRADDPRALVAAIVRPDLEQAAAVAARTPGGHRLVAAIYLRPGAFVRALVERSFAPVAERFLPHLQQAIPSVDPSELAWRVRWVVFGTLGARLADEDLDLSADGPDVELDRLVATLTGALTAPPAPSARKAPP